MEEKEVKKRRMPRWLTFKRALALILVLGVGVFLLIYLLGGYKQSLSGYNARPFTKEGFEFYVDYQEELFATVDDLLDQLPYDPNDSWDKKIELVRFREEMTTIIGLIVAEKNQAIADNDQALEDIFTALEDTARARYRELASRKEYKEAFIESYFELILDNDDYEFYFNRKNTTFQLKEKATGYIWYSNPPVGAEVDFANSINNQKSLLNIEYIGNRGATKRYSTYAYSVVDKNPNEDLMPNFAIKVDQDKKTIQILYVLEKRGADYTRIPYKISEERMDEVLARNATMVESGELSDDQLINDFDLLMIKTAYFELKEDKSTGAKYYVQSGVSAPDKIKTQSLLYLTNVFVNQCGYTAEEAIDDYAEFDIVISPDLATFEVAIELALTDTGLQVTLLSDSIVEPKAYPIAFIEILPYFTASHYSVDGYMIIPDGSGAVMNYNNGKTTYPAYYQRIYGTDLSKEEKIKPIENEDLMFPMYAVVNTSETSGMLVDVLDGASQMMLSADISKRVESFNKIFYRAYYRESQLVTTGTGTYSRFEYIKWTTERVKNDMVIDYIVLTKDELDYSTIAKKYREILIERYDIKPNDTTKSTAVNIDIIGVYDFRNNFLGIGYSDYDTMTNFEEIIKIIEDLDQHPYINLFLHGWRDKGLVDESFKNMNYNKLLGKKQMLNKLIDVLNEKQIDLYPYVNFGTVNKYQESFGKNYYSIRDASNDIVETYPYNQSSYLFDKSKNQIYSISPKYYERFMQNIVDNYKLGIPNMLFNHLGSSLSTDFEKYNEFSKYSAILTAISAMQTATDNFEKIALYAPYDFAIPYTKLALEVPYTSSTHEILDYSIPFYQLVVSGLFDYSGMAINANEEKGFMYHMMHILETGSNIQFVFSFDDSAKLIQTDYNYYYFTEYIKWLSDVEKYTTEIDKIGIHEMNLVGHLLVGNNTYKVIYRNSTEELIIYLNYSDASVVVDGKTIPSMNYIYEKGAL